MTVFIIDDWHGVTDMSKEFVKKNYTRLGDILRIECIETDLGYVTTIKGSTDTRLQTNGFSCGYSGEGPHGLLWLINEIAHGKVTIEEIAGTKHFVWEAQK